MLTKPTEPIGVENAAAICERFTLGDEARSILRAGLSPEVFIHQLEQKRLYTDALGFLAHWLTRREAVWWGCQCLWDVFRPRMPARSEAALQAAVRWVLAPTEGTRRAAEAAGEAAGAKDPAGCLALAAFWSGGSLLAANLPTVEPPPHLTAITVKAALLVSAARAAVDPAQQPHRQFVSLGLDIAHGKNLWH